MNTITSEELARDLLNPFKDVLLKGGIDEGFLIDQLKKEFNSQEPKIIKIKGSIEQSELPEGFEVVANSGMVYEGEKGVVRLDGETIIQYKVDNIGTMQKARMDVHKLRGDYPAEKMDHNVKGDITVNIIKFSDKNKESDD